MGKHLVWVALLAIACSKKEEAKPAPAVQQDTASHTVQPAAARPAAPDPATPPPAAAQTERGSNRDAIFAALERFKQEMCACTDARCAERVSDDKIRWLQTTARNAGYPANLTADEAARADALDAAIRKCEETAFDTVPVRKK